MATSALERLGVYNPEELLNAIISLPPSQHLPSSYSKVTRVNELTVQTLSAETVEIPLVELGELCPLNSIHASLPWVHLLTLEDIARYAQTLQNYSESFSPFLQAQFFHIMLPSLDVHFTYYLLSYPSIETTIEYFSNLKNFIKSWLLMSTDILSKDDIMAKCEGNSTLTFARVIIESRHIMFNLIKKLFSIARKASYGIGFSINLDVYRRKQEHNCDFSFDVLISELKAPLLQFISTEAMSWTIIGELLHDLILLFPSSYQDISDLVISRLFKHMRENPKDASQSILNVLVQIYKTLNQTSSRETLSLALRTATELLTSGSVQTKRTTIGSVISLLQYNEPDPNQADAIYRQYPFDLIALNSADLDAGTKMYLTEMLTERDSVRRFISHSPEYLTLLHSLITLEGIEHLIDFKKWNNIDTLVDIKCSLISTDTEQTIRIVVKALARSMPVRLFPLFVTFPIRLLVNLYEYYHRFKDERILIHVCLCTRNRFSIVRRMIMEESRFPAWAKFAHTCETQTSQKFLMWTWKMTKRRLSICPRWLMFEIANLYI